MAFRGDGTILHGIVRDAPLNRRHLDKHLKEVREEGMEMSVGRLVREEGAGKLVPLSGVSKGELCRG